MFIALHDLAVALIGGGGQCRMQELFNTHKADKQNKQT